MKITAITPYLIRANEGGATERPRGRNWLCVAVHTDAGIVGYGEGGWPEVVAHGGVTIATTIASARRRRCGGGIRDWARGRVGAWTSGRRSA